MRFHSPTHTWACMVLQVDVLEYPSLVIFWNHALTPVSYLYVGVEIVCLAQWATIEHNLNWLCFPETEIGLALNSGATCFQNETNLLSVCKIHICIIQMLSVYKNNVHFQLTGYLEASELAAHDCFNNAHAFCKLVCRHYFEILIKKTFD